MLVNYILLNKLTFVAFPSIITTIHTLMHGRYHEIGMILRQVEEIPE